MGGIVQSHYPGCGLHETSVGHHEGVLSVLVIHPDGQVSGKLDVLLLVVSHGDDIGVVKKDVRRHEHRVGQKTCSHGFLSLGL